MNLMWVILLGSVIWAVLFLFLFALCKVSGDEDRAAGESEGSIDQSAHVATAELIRICQASATTHGNVSKSPERTPAAVVV